MVSSVSGVAAYHRVQAAQPVQHHQEKHDATPVKKKEAAHESPPPQHTRKKHAVDVRV